MNTTNSRVLVIDDNPRNLDVLSELLDKQNFVVLFALDGMSGIQRAESGYPDLILLDIMMPGLDGYETCQRLKTGSKTQNIPVIFMSALSDTINKVKGFECGAVDYITKPIEPEEVLARINTHLTIQNLQNELQVKNKELEVKNKLLADHEAHLIHLVEQKTQKIENITLALVNALENANALNDDDTGKHILRIGEYSAFLAEKYGCDQQFVKRIKLYAPLHDVGKVGLSDALLKKNGKYTNDEFIMMQQHVVFGAQLLESEGIDVMAGAIALYHHEKWNGNGYIHQLAGEDIPLEARIVAVADVYDAMISKRVYKEALTEEETYRIIREESGQHFDSDIIEVFFQYKNELRDIRLSLL